MDYAPYLVSCHEQTLPGAYEKFQWQEKAPRQETTGRRSSCADVSTTNYCRLRHDWCPDDRKEVPSSWHRFASIELISVLDSVRSLSRSNHRSDKHGSTGAGQSSFTVPQGTATRSAKKVSFADEVGLTLTTVRFICDSDSSHLSSGSSSSYRALAKRQPVVAPRFLTKFSLPESSDDHSFRRKVESCNVILSRFVIKDGVIRGEIEVRNIAYEKSVSVRYTASDWNYFSDVGASYVTRSEQTIPGYDAFSFQFPVPLDPEASGRVEFAIRYEVSGQTFWDNNGRRNYEIVTVGEEMMTPTTVDAIPREFQDIRTGKGGSGGGVKKVVQRERKQNTTDSIVFSVRQPKPIVVWTEFISWKWDMNYNNLPFW